MTTFWAYRKNDDGHLFVEIEEGAGRVLELHLTKERAEKRCPAECFVQPLTDSQLNEVFNKRPLYGVYINGQLMVWVDFKKEYMPGMDGV